MPEESPAVFGDALRRLVHGRDLPLPGRHPLLVLHPADGHQARRGHRRAAPARARTRSTAEIERRVREDVRQTGLLPAGPPDAAHRAGRRRRPRRAAGGARPGLPVLQGGRQPRRGGGLEDPAPSAAAPRGCSRTRSRSSRSMRPGSRTSTRGSASTSPGRRSSARRTRSTSRRTSCARPRPSWPRPTPRSPRASPRRTCGSWCRSRTSPPTRCGWSASSSPGPRPSRSGRPRSSRTRSCSSPGSPARACAWSSTGCPCGAATTCPCASSPTTSPATTTCRA